MFFADDDGIKQGEQLVAHRRRTVVVRQRFAVDDDRLLRESFELPRERELALEIRTDLLKRRDRVGHPWCFIATTPDREPRALLAWGIARGKPREREILLLLEVPAATELLRSELVHEQGGR